MGGDESGVVFAGLALAIASALCIGSSFILKKLGLRKLRAGYARPSAGGFRYLREWLWWLGLLTMGAGEAFNFIAYAFAPASLVTPLGALSVLVSAILASKFLDEKLNLLGKIGCFLCIIGSTVIVIHAPKQEEIDSLEQLEFKLQEPLFLCYFVLIIFVYFVIAFYLGPRYGSQNIVVYLLLCSAVGSITVVFCKGIGISLRETLSGSTYDLDNWVFWTLIVLTVICIMIQMNYLNKSLDVFNTSIVTPIYYVMFTTLVIVASAILFKEWEALNGFDILGNICGFLTVIVGIVLLNAFKDSELNVSVQFKPRRELAYSDETDNCLEVNYGSYTRNT